MRTVKVISIILLLFNAIGALPAGFLFIIDPSGSKMGMNTDYLQHSPFHTFLIPGIVLFLVNGVYSCITAYACYKKHPYAPIMIMMQGLLLIGLDHHTSTYATNDRCIALYHGDCRVDVIGMWVLDV